MPVLRFLKNISAVILTLVCCINTHAQDPDISQTFAAPLQLNPALTGAFEGTFRISSTYRNQWGALIEEPFKTFMFSGDTRLALGSKFKSKDKVAAGLSFVSDNVNPWNFSTNAVSVSGAFHKFLDVENGSYLSAGLIAGIGQKNFIYESFTFQDQFNGIDGYTFQSAEALPRNNHAYFDIGVGVHYSLKATRWTSYGAGLSILHINEPNISFYQDEGPEEINVANVPLSRRYTAHVNANMDFRNDLSIQPRIVYSNQGKHTTILAGTGSRFLLNDVVQNAMHFGLWFKANQLYDNLEITTAVLMTGFEFRGVIFGLSYDLAFIDFGDYNFGQDVFEFSIRYIGDYEDPGEFCPQF